MLSTEHVWDAPTSSNLFKAGLLTRCCVFPICVSFADQMRAGGGQAHTLVWSYATADLFRVKKQRRCTEVVGVMHKKRASVLN